MTCTNAMTLGEIVTADFRAAAIFERHGLDFCCRGNRTLEQSCRDAGARADEVLEQLEAIDTSPSAGRPSFNEWTLPELADYIVTQHHAYVRDALPVLLAHSTKIAEGARRPASRARPRRGARGTGGGRDDEPHDE